MREKGRKMKTRSTKKKTAAAGRLYSPMPELVTTPATPADSLSDSPNEFEFNFNTTKRKSSVSTKKKNYTGGASASMMKPTGKSSSPSLKSISTVSDLKELASSRLESIKRQLERSHSEICKDLEASESRLQKRLKIQTQACQQVVDDAEREHKKLSDQISEGRDAMKASYSEFMAEAHASAARLCKTSIPSISESVENALNSLHCRYGVPSTSVR